MKRLLLISSEGGHLSELLQLSPVFKKYDYKIITEKTKATLFLNESFKDHVSYLLYGTKDHLLTYIFIFPINIILSLIFFLIYHPDAVISTGTHTAVPMCYIAHLFKIKVIYIETFASVNHPSKAGKLIYKVADLFVVQWKELLKYFPDAEYWGWLY